MPSAPAGIDLLGVDRVKVDSHVTAAADGMRLGLFFVLPGRYHTLQFIGT